MNFDEVINNRESIRLFEDREVENSILSKIVEHASRAPSPANLQPWQFLIVKNKDLIGKIVDTTYSGLIKDSSPQSWVKTAPALIIVYFTPRYLVARVGEDGRDQGLLCTGAAVENLLLSAVNYGLGACWVGNFRKEELKKAVNLHRDEEVVAIIPIGYPKEHHNSPPKLPLEELMTVIE
ncbi:MAG: nitroreductase family protein [Nitrososphaeria archaeon]